MPTSVVMKIDNFTHPNCYRELLQSRSKIAQLPKWVRAILELLSHLILLPIIGRLLQHSYMMVCYAIGRYYRLGEYNKFYVLIINSLNNRSFKKDPTHWWHLMRLAVAVTQERQIQWLVRDSFLEDNLILLASLGPHPLKGYDVAYVFIGFALWLFERGNVLAAIHMVQIAEHADETWGYPEYLHGWFGLFTKGVNSVEHFTRAVQTDWSFLQKMKQDKTCRDNPDVLHEVQKRTLVAK